MRLRFFLTYLVVAVIASGWVLFDLYSAIVLDGIKGTASSEGTITSILNMPILAGILILLFSFYRYPYGPGNYKRNKQIGSKKESSAPLILTSKKISREWQSSQDKETQDAEIDHDNSLSTDSTMLFMESTTLDVDDYFAIPTEDVAHREYDQEVQTFDFSGESSSESLEPLVEAEVLAKFGRFNQAIEILLDEFTGNEGNCDEIATQILKFINNELGKESTKLERMSLLELEINEIVNVFSNGRAKLSDEIWQKIQLLNPIQTAITEDSDPEEALVVQWR